MKRQNIIIDLFLLAILMASCQMPGTKIQPRFSRFVLHTIGVKHGLRQILFQGWNCFLPAGCM